VCTSANVCTKTGDRFYFIMGTGLKQRYHSVKMRNTCIHHLPVMISTADAFTLRIAFCNLNYFCQILNHLRYLMLDVVLLASCYHYKIKIDVEFLIYH
jgi:hypothetical protein